MYSQIHCFVLRLLSFLPLSQFERDFTLLGLGWKFFRVDQLQIFSNSLSVLDLALKRLSIVHVGQV